MLIIATQLIHHCYVTAWLSSTEEMIYKSGVALLLNAKFNMRQLISTRNVPIEEQNEFRCRVNNGN